MSHPANRCDHCNVPIERGEHYWVTVGEYYDVACAKCWMINNMEHRCKKWYREAVMYALEYIAITGRDKDDLKCGQEERRRLGDGGRRINTSSDDE